MHFWTYLVPVVASFIGLVCCTSLFTKLGFYRFLAKVYWDASLVGLTPAYHYGIPWGVTYEELESIDLVGQTAIVTGGNAGIGYAICEQLYKMGATVTMACRNLTKCEEAAARIRKQNPLSRGTIQTALINTETLVTVKNFATTYLQDYPDQPLDMLFLNAGTIFFDNQKQCVDQSVDGVEKIFATNYLGHHLLFRLLEPALQKSKLARVVSTTSNLSFTTYPWKVATDLETLNGCSLPWLSRSWGLENHSYGQSKLAQVVWTKYVSRKRHGQSNIYVNAFHPGAAATEIWDKAGKEGCFPSFVVRFINWLRSEAMWTSAEGALTGLMLGTNAQRLQNENIRGRLYFPQAQEVVNPMSLDESLQDRLWAFSEMLVKDYLVDGTSPQSSTTAA